MKFETQACSFSPIKPRMTRRDFIALLGTTAAAWPLRANALGALTNLAGDNRDATTRELGCNNGPTYVYFFGGYRSTVADVQSWGKSLEAKVPGATAIVFPIHPAPRPVIRCWNGAVRGTLLCRSWREPTSRASSSAIRPDAPSRMMLPTLPSILALRISS